MALEAVRAATESLQVEVVHEAWFSQDGLGAPEYDAPVLRPALVQEGVVEHVKTLSGREVMARARITFFPDPETGTPPAISSRDRITLPGGLIGPIVEIRGALVNPGTNTPWVTVVWLG
jgi:hypothetical protein